jgi:hypothetical protein
MIAQRITSVRWPSVWQVHRLLRETGGIILGILASFRWIRLLVPDLNDVITWTRSGCGRRHGQAGPRQGLRSQHAAQIRDLRATVRAYANQIQILALRAGRLEDDHKRLTARLQHSGDNVTPLNRALPERLVAVRHLPRAALHEIEPPHRPGHLDRSHNHRPPLSGLERRLVALMGDLPGHRPRGKLIAGRLGVIPGVEVDPDLLGQWAEIIKLVQCGGQQRGVVPVRSGQHPVKRQPSGWAGW